MKIRSVWEPHKNYLAGRAREPEPTNCARAHEEQCCQFRKSLNPGDINVIIAREGTFLSRDLEIFRIKTRPKWIMSLQSYNAERRPSHNEVFSIYFYTCLSFQTHVLQVKKRRSEEWFCFAWPSVHACQYGVQKALASKVRRRILIFGSCSLWF
jgi:hypothetical protein